jgi:hypothetical protein
MNEQRPSPVVSEDVRAFASSPARFFNHSYYAMHHLDAQRLTALQLDAVRMRFAEQRERIATLTTMADELGVQQIDAIDDVVPLLFQHSVYKSYPQALLEKSRFGHLTRWLDRLTPCDLSQVDADACDTIDAWLDVLDANTPIRVAHTSGTAGTMSFLPRSLDDWEHMFEAMRCGLFQFSDPLGERDHTGEYFNLIWPIYRHGRSALTRMPDLAMKQLFGSEQNLHVAREGSMSADAVYLAARIKAATARGELDRLTINPALLARRAEFEREQKELMEGMPRFLGATIMKLKGQRIWLSGTWNVLYMMAKAALDKGLEGVFSPDSLVTTGGGAKGQVVPDDWQDTVRRFAGVPRLQHVYAMSETTGMHKMCEHEHYHIEPWVVAFVLDPETGAPLPREGVQTGRMACFDVLPTSYWGGFITGDEVTMHWDPCPCGRTTAHIERRIERYSDKHGDDKITCAASEEAHRMALDFLTQRLD